MRIVPDSTHFLDIFPWSQSEVSMIIFNNDWIPNQIDDLTFIAGYVTRSLSF